MVSSLSRLSFAVYPHSKCPGIKAAESSPRAREILQLGNLFNRTSCAEPSERRKGKTNTFDPFCFIGLSVEISSLIYVFPLQKGCMGEGTSFLGIWEVAEFGFCEQKAGNSKSELHVCSACSNCARMPAPERSTQSSCLDILPISSPPFPV